MVKRTKSAVAVIVPSPTRTRACPSSGALRVGRSRMNPTSAAGEGCSMLPHVLMGEGYLARTPHPFESAGRPLCPLPQGERAREATTARLAQSSCFETHRSAVSVVEGLGLGWRCDAPQHEGRRDQPAGVENGRRRGLPVSGLFFTGSCATGTCIPESHSQTPAGGAQTHPTAAALAGRAGAAGAGKSSVIKARLMVAWRVAEVSFAPNRSVT